MTIQTTEPQTPPVFRMVARRTLFAAALSTVCIGAAVRTENAWAQAQGEPLISLQVVDRETGETARVWRHAGKLYVAGQPGARYSLRMTNNSSGRLLAVLSVDGVNILTGETAAYSQGGYVLGPYQTYDVNGWRKSDSEIAAFHFAPLAGSYAAQTGRPDDVGVIGVAAFREREAAPVAVSPPKARDSLGSHGAPPPALTIPPVERRAEAASPPPPLPIPPVERRVVTQAPPPLPIPPVERRVETPAPRAMSATPPARPQAESSIAAPGARLGTGHGAREWSRVATVSFIRATLYPQYTYRLEYDSQARLIASGVMPRVPSSPAPPRPFPGNRNGYVPDPPYGR